MPTAKVGAKLNVQHDYVMLTATFSDGTFRYTTARYSEKMSGSLVNSPSAKAAFRNIAQKLEGVRNGTVAGTIGDVMSRYLEMANETIARSEGSEGFFRRVANG